MDVDVGVRVAVGAGGVRMCWVCFEWVGAWAWMWV